MGFKGKLVRFWSWGEVISGSVHWKLYSLTFFNNSCLNINTSKESTETRGQANFILAIVEFVCGIETAKSLKTFLKKLDELAAHVLGLGSQAEDLGLNPAWDHVPHVILSVSPFQFCLHNKGTGCPNKSLKKRIIVGKTSSFVRSFMYWIREKSIWLYCLGGFSTEKLEQWCSS